MSKLIVNKVGFFGRTNSGKSTLMNALLECPLSAVSSRAQCTRQNIKGILNLYDKEGRWSSQNLLIDTPGMSHQKTFLDRSFSSSLQSALEEINIAVFLLDATKAEKNLKQFALKQTTTVPELAWLESKLEKYDQITWIVALTKIDLLPKASLLPIMQSLQERFPKIKAIVPVCSVSKVEDKNSNLLALMHELQNLGSHSDNVLCDEKHLSLMTPQDLLINFTREALFQKFYDELPYDVECQVLDYQKPGAGQRKSEAHMNLLVARDSLKAILLGKRGEKIKAVGIHVRERFQEIYKQDLVLKLHVKVMPRWQKNSNLLQELGYQNG